MNPTQSLEFYGALACVGAIVVAFIAWFSLRKSPGGDTACIAMATLAEVLLVLIATSDRVLSPCLGPFIVGPGSLIYLWFLGLWASRRTLADVYRWGRQHGYHVTSVERTMGYPYDSMGRQASYKIVARNVHDGRIRVGWVWVGRVLTGYRDPVQVHWEGEIPVHGPGVHPHHPGRPGAPHPHPGPAASPREAVHVARGPGLGSLSERERDIVRSAIGAILHGPFLRDPEFQTRTGRSREEVRRFLQAWPPADDSNERSEASVIIHACLNEVAHALELSPEQWREWFGPEVTPETVRNVLAKWTQAQGGPGSGSK